MAQQSFLHNVDLKFPAFGCVPPVVYLFFLLLWHLSHCCDEYYIVNAVYKCV